MAQARCDNSARFRPYTVTRDYKLFAKERVEAKSQVIADIAFVPPGSKNFTIQHTSGMGLGERIVRRMLAGEAEIAKDDRLAEMSPRNYDFRFVREEELDGRHCYVLELLPRRKDGNLLHGTVWVDAKTYLPRRTEGRPAKTPSWWVRDLQISLSYGEVEGMWLQTGLEATATVRILGPYTIISRDLKYNVGERTAEVRPLR